jgi:hypothetical protein
VGTTDQTDRGEKASSDYFEVAKQAAARGEPHRMLEALALSGFLDGLVRSLSTKWARMPEDEVKDCIALAVDKTYQAISQGRSVRDLGAWLWKIADNTVTSYKMCLQAPLEGRTDLWVARPKQPSSESHSERTPSQVRSR